MLIIKKIVTVVAVLLVGLIVFGYLPRHLSERITRAILALMIIGFVVRVASYLLANQ